MSKEKKYSIYVLLKRTPIEIEQLRKILKKDDLNEMLEELLLSIQYLLKDKNQKRYIDCYITNLKQTVRELIDNQNLNTHKTLENFKKITSSIYVKKISHKKNYLRFVEEIKDILIAKQVNQEEKDQYSFLYSII